MPDFYSLVPKDMAGNLAYRLELRRRAASDSGFARACMAACKEDVLFFFSAFCWLYEPRPRYDDDGHLLPKMIPMLPWEHQEPIILDAKKWLGIRDIGIEKSRGEGMSWMGVLLACHDWLFDDLAKIGIVSNTEKKADDPGNLDSLGAKADFVLSKLPKWMTGVKDVDWTRNLADHSWVNRRNGSQINAFAATADAGRAGRYKWFLTDELAFWDPGKDAKFLNSIRGSTDSRLVISTPNGTDGAYYHFMHNPSNAIKLRLHWSQNRTKNRGLYRMVDGKPVAVDPENNPLPKDYDPPSQAVVEKFARLRQKGFRLDTDRLRSPWYDDECDRADSTPFSIAQELDLDYGGSTYRVFGPEFFSKAEATVREPLVRGTLDFDRETLVAEFQEVAEGPVLMWTRFKDGRPPDGQYVIGADIAAGTGGSFSSNSVMTVIDVRRNEQVLEWATNTTEPRDFADYCIATAKLFNNAYLIWEHNGIGSSFTKQVLHRRYTNLYYRTPLTQRGRKKTKRAGWQTTDGVDGTKGIMFSGLRKAVVHGGFQIRSKATVRECGEYVWKNGKIVNVHLASNEDDSAAGEAHGDRVIALCVCNMGVDDRPVMKQAEAPKDIPPNSMAARMREYERQEQAEGDDWDDRSNWDLAHRGKG